MAYTVMSNVHDEENASVVEVSATEQEKSQLRRMAERWMEIASSDDIAEKKRQWKALRDLKPERPMVLFETFSVSEFVTESDLLCSDPFLRNVEKSLLYGIRQYEDLGDDIVLEKYFRLPWEIFRSNYGVELTEQHVEGSMAYLSTCPIKTPDDLDKLRDRTFRVEREATLARKAVLEDLFAGVLPVRVGNYDNFLTEPGFNPFTGNNFIGTTMDAFKLIGNENLLMWGYDEPEALHRLMRFLTDDRIRFFDWMMQEQLLDYNSDNQFAGPSGYGYNSELPGVDTERTPEFQDLWVWAESQETTMVSPDMFDEFFLCYLAEVANRFGLSYYGCCERLDDRFEKIKKALPNLRTVSVSGWSDFEKIAELMGTDYVYCRKPTPAPISNDGDWKGMEKDLQMTADAVARHGCPVELVVRDVYEIQGDMKRLKDWVQLAKKTFGCL